jgi:hypothetical protein
MQKPDKENLTTLEDLKKEYELLKNKYSLPEFSKLNELFDIEEVDTDTEFLLRRIRRVVADKILGYLKFVEVILNPSNAPIFFFKLIKKLDDKDRENLAKIYEELAKIEVDVISLDLEYSEKQEAEYVKKLYDSFNNNVKGELLSIIKKLGNGDNNKKKENGNSYFG